MAGVISGGRQNLPALRVTFFDKLLLHQMEAAVLAGWIENVLFVYDPRIVDAAKICFKRRRYA